MTNLDVLMSATPGFLARFRDLEQQVLTNGGPLDPRSAALTSLGVALALEHPATQEILLWAKQAGLKNEEIGHVTAIALALRLRRGQPSEGPEAGNGGADRPTAGCC